MRRLLYPVLGYRKALAVADTIAPLDGHAVMRHLRDLLELRVEVDNLEAIPAEGGAILVANHPTGIADGIALYDMLAERRSDLAVFVNQDALRVCPGLAELMIPVPWRADARNHASSRATLKAAVKAFEGGRLVVLFPSGRLARMTDNGLRERAWLPTAVTFAQRFEVPIVPLHIQARNSSLYYLFSEISNELRDMTLFHEVLNKRRYRYRMTVGQPIAPGELVGDPVDLTARLQRYVEFELPARGDARTASSAATFSSANGR